MRILVFGDSIAQGFYDREGGWADRLKKHFDKQLIEENDSSQPTVFNLGISGDFTYSVAERLESEIKARIWPNESFVIVFSIGINDTVYRDKEYDSTPEKYKVELKKILAVARKYTQKILFVSLFPVKNEVLQPMPWSTAGKCYSTERIREFNKVLNRFCEENSLPLVDIWTVFENNTLDEISFDGIHPNDKGHELIADSVLPVLEECMR